MHSWFLPFVGACLALCGAAGAFCARSGRLRFAFMALEGDEDMKIAPGSFSETRSAEDAAEQAAREFLRQKQSGNIDRARALGSRYARALLNAGQGPLAGEPDEGNPLVRRHQYLLYAYVVNRVIADHSPDSILAQTSLNVFYGEIECESPELYRHVSDMAAFSLYILFDRSKSRVDDEIGLIFAKLCGQEGDPGLARYANELYARLHAFCLEQIENTRYL